MTMTPPQRQAGYQSRDLSDTAASGVGTIPRTRSGQRASEHTIPQRVRHPRQLQREAPKPKQKRRFQHQAGSQQILSIRGRRVRQERVDPATVAFMVLATLAVVAGLAFTMFVTGVTTQQSFRIQNLREQNTVLNNQLETLNRDLADVSSTSNLAQQAAAMGMVLPVQAGILALNAEGNVIEQREASADSRPIVDVNSITGSSNEEENATDDAAANDAASTNAATNNATTNAATTDSGDAAAAEIAGVGGATEEVVEEPAAQAVVEDEATDTVDPAIANLVQDLVPLAGTSGDTQVQ